MIYLQKESEESPDSLKVSPYSYKLQTGDLLAVTIYTADQTSGVLFNNSSPAAIQQLPPDLMALTKNYPVNDSGYINLPVIGELFVKGLDLNQTKKLIETEATTYLNKPQVAVFLANFRISILGEVVRPGSMIIYNTQITLFDALAMAGDLKPVGNRKNVKILRKEGNFTHVHIIDLTRQDVIASEFYYLRPNDIVYVQPLKIRGLGLNNENTLQIILTALSTIAIILNVTR